MKSFFLLFLYLSLSIQSPTNFLSRRQTPNIPNQPRFNDIVNQGVQRILQHYPNSQIREIKGTYTQNDNQPPVKEGAYRLPDALDIKMSDADSKTFMTIRADANDAQQLEWGTPTPIQHPTLSDFVDEPIDLHALLSVGVDPSRTFDSAIEQLPAKIAGYGEYYQEQWEQPGRKIAVTEFTIQLERLDNRPSLTFKLLVDGGKVSVEGWGSKPLGAWLTTQL